MFEVPQDKQETKKMRLLIGAAAVVVLVVVAVVYFTAKPSAQGPAAAAPAVPCQPDPVNDLRVVDSKMDKDLTGTWAVWSIRLRNKSAGCTYSDIEYETTYVRADDTILLVNKGTLPGIVAPGAEKDYTEHRDALFPAGTAWFRLKITGAKVATP